MIFSLQGLGPAVLFWIYFNKPELLWGPSPRQRSGVQRGRVGSLDWDMMYIYNYIIIIIYIYISLVLHLTHSITQYIYICKMVAGWVQNDAGWCCFHGFDPFDDDPRWSSRTFTSPVSTAPLGTWGTAVIFRKGCEDGRDAGPSWILGPWGLGALGAAFANRYSGCFRLVSMAQDGDFLRSMERKSISRH